MDFKNVVSAIKSVSCSSFFLFLFTFYLSSFLAQAARNPPPPKQIYHVVNLSSLHTKTYCESPRTGSELGSGKIRMASRNGPCSPHNPAAKKMSSYESLFTEKANSDGSSAGYMEYFVTIGVGTPKADFTMLVDTGSDNTWVGCKPCSTGCGPKDHLFDPSKSSTYVNGSCRPSTDGDDGQFSVTYGDTSKSKGYWGCDTLTTDQSYYAVKNFQFGCGQEIQNDDNSGDYDGILGLGRGDLSLPSQGGTNFQKFSYCLPKRNSKQGYLVFGNEAQAKSSSSKPQFTPLLPPPENLPRNYIKKSYYFVELIGMSVAGKRLDVAPSVFNSTGTIIDSGTSITLLPQEAYSALTTAFNQSMASKYPAAAASNKNIKHLGTCYNVDTSNVIVPAITFHFKGMSAKGEIDVELRQSGIVLVPQSKPNLVCLGFAKQKDGLAIIGNHQQRQMAMSFDLQGNSLGFGTNNCDE